VFKILEKERINICRIKYFWWWYDPRKFLLCKRLGRGGSTRSFETGEIFRIDDFGETLYYGILFVVVGALGTAIVSLLPSSPLTGMIPSLIFLANIALTVTGIIAMFAIPDKGIFYTLGWTFVSILLLWYGFIGAGEFMMDMIPLGILIIYAVAESGILDNLFGGEYSGGYL
jgi:hypothetical protein